MYTVCNTSIRDHHRYCFGVIFFRLSLPRSDQHPLEEWALAGDLEWKDLFPLRECGRSILCGGVTIRVLFHLTSIDEVKNVEVDSFEDLDM